MPLIALPAADAQMNLRNRAARWPDGRMETRLSGVAVVQPEASFQLENGEPIFTIGSCFARNIEQRLGELGFDVVTRRVALPESETGSRTENNILNKYAPHSILNEVRWALDPGAAFPEDGFLQVDENLWHDPHSARQIAPAPLERVRERRAMIDALYRELVRCRVVVMTLGLVEAWHDAKTGLYLNEAPLPAILRAEPERFQLHVLSVAEILAALEEVYALLKAHGHPEFRVILTVSPVPMKVTYTGRDVLAANTYSKSALRAAAETFAIGKPEVDYFPSYEIVTLTNRVEAFNEDNRHVSSETIDAIVERMVRAYAPALAPEEMRIAGQSAKDIRTRIKDHYKKNDSTKLVALLSALDDEDSWELAGYPEAEFRLLYGRALLRLQQPYKAEMQLARAAELERDSAVVLYLLGHARSQLGFHDKAEADLRRAAELDPSQPSYLVRYARALVQNERFAAAEKLLLALVRKGADADAAALLNELHERLGSADLPS